MARRKRDVSLDFAFFQELWSFYQHNRAAVRRHYKDLTKKFLDHNNPANGGAFLRPPQFEALEMYVFLKEFLGNRRVDELFNAWRSKEEPFKSRSQITLFETEMNVQYDQVFERMRRSARTYSNYIFALTMGTGKTILMATCIFYEFLLANKFPKDPRYCHNALVFAPDKTVLHSLREIQTFDMRKVVPPDYLNWLTTHIQFHFLDEAGTVLSTLDSSRFNLIISNTQKVILKRQNRDRTAVERLMESGKTLFQKGSVYDQAADLYGFSEPDSDEALTTNQRFEKLRRLPQLGIYVDEAHHAFGNALAADMGVKDSITSLRRTIDELAGSLERSGSRVVACYNYTGTPYVGSEVLPEVVYAYGLKEAIEKGFLKQIRILSYTNTRNDEFIERAVGDFIEQVGQERYEGMLPKIAFFAATIGELQGELRPSVERALAKRGLPSTLILENHQNATNDEEREFRRLDTPGSAKQFVLLVNKGREGWNCRSLFGVGLYREPRSKIFVLQASMRCLRAITEVQQTGNVYLSDDNKALLDAELRQNFRVSVDEISAKPDEKRTYQVRLLPPPVVVKLKRVRKLYNTRERAAEPGYSLELDQIDPSRYTVIETKEEGVELTNHFVSKRRIRDITAEVRGEQYSRITLVYEVARYLNRSPLFVEDLLSTSKEGARAVLETANRLRGTLHDWIIPRLFHQIAEVQEFTHHEEHSVSLIRAPAHRDFYEVRARPEMVVTSASQGITPELAAKSFHLDTYCFDSNPERELFWRLLRDQQVSRLYFTGMLTHGQTEFFVQYIDPESRTIRSYYPDFLIQKGDGSYVILEVKADFQINDPVVRAKQDFATQMATASGMRYAILPSSLAEEGAYKSIL